MKLFTTKEEKLLKQLLACAVDQDEVLSLASLHGFLSCLAIIPEAIAPSEWLPIVFGEEMIEVADETEANRLMGGLMAVYNRFVSAGENDQPVFPYDLDKLKTADIDRVRQWAFGFFLGTNLRPEVWGLPDEDEDIPEDEGEESEEEQEVAACMAVLMGVAFPDRIAELFEEEPGVEMDQDELKEREAKFFVVLPRAIEVFQGIASEQRDAQRDENRQGATAPIPLRRAEKVGRNEPCPCGSGKKYKKCCGVN